MDYCSFKCFVNWHSQLQDQGLDVIAEGLDTLKNMAHDMNEVGYFFYFFAISLLETHARSSS